MEKAKDIKAAAFITVFIIFLIIMLAIIWPFYRSISTALICTILAIPAFNYIKSIVRSRTISAATCILLIIFALVLPFVFIMVQVFNEINDIAAVLSNTMKPGQIEKALDFISGNPYISPVKMFIEQQIASLEIDLLGGAYQAAESLAKYMASHSIALIKNITWFIAEIFIVLISVFFMLKDSDKLIKTVKSFSPFKPEETSILLSKIRDTVYATVFGGIIVALAQGTLGGIGFYLLGLPSPVLWGTVMALLAMIPFLGAPVVWFPVVVVLLMKGLLFKAVMLFIWGAFVVGLVDNLLRPIVIGSRTQLHPLLVFFSVFGGLILIGPIGIFIGPVMLSLTLTTADFIKERYKS
ncbi:MAG: AI-2E family transporter [Candidatus Margulisiibacteriota bacterium]